MAQIQDLLVANFFRTTLVVTITPGDTQLTVADASGFPAPNGINEYFYLTVVDGDNNAEIVRVGSVSGTVLTLFNDAGGAGQTSFTNGFSAANSRAELWLTAEAFRDVQTALEGIAGSDYPGVDEATLTAASGQLSIKDAGVSTAKIADDAILAQHIVDEAVRTAAIQTAAVTTAKIANGAVTDAKITSMDAGKLTGALPRDSVQGAVERTDPADSLTAGLDFNHIRFDVGSSPSGGSPGDIVIEWEDV
jgi:hypothetical protein